jgi:hypothetical protein
MTLFSFKGSKAREPTLGKGAGLRLRFFDKGDDAWFNWASISQRASRSSIPIGEKSPNIGDESDRVRFRERGVLTTSGNHLVSTEAPGVSVRSPPLR